jgi:hypothetical protein
MWLILLIFMIAAFCGGTQRILGASGLESSCHKQSTNLSTENVHNGKSIDRLTSYGDFAEIERENRAK